MSDISRELAERVAAAYQEERALNIGGGGSKPFIGRATEGETLEVAGHRGIVAYQPTELVLTARSGTPMAEIREALAEHGQYCPFESPLFGYGATLGGTLACNLSGSARPWMGSIRDAVLGTRLINGKGEHMKFGGQVMKNVAGYDVSRLQAGALGTLGVITEVSIKVLPKQAASATVAQEMDAAGALERMNRIAGRSSPLTGAAWVEGRLHLRFEGAERAVESAVAKWGGEPVRQAAVFWEDLAEQKLAFFRGDAPLWRLSVRSTAPLAQVDAPWLLEWGGAQRWLRGEFNQTELEQQAHAAGGHLTLFRHGDRSGEVFHTPSAIQRRIHEHVKAAFDPEGILNPGRLYSWL